MNRASSATGEKAVLTDTTGRTNVAAASNGGTVTASSTYASGFDASGTINGDRKGQSWGSGGGWNDATPGAWPDWLEVDFAGAKTIDEVDVFSVQDNYTAPEEPTAGMTFTRYGLTAFTVQYWDGTQWLAVPNGVVVANALVWRPVTFAPITTTKIRILVTGTLDSWSRVTEVEAYQAAGPGNTAPTVTLTAPADGTTYTAPASITFTATAADADGTVARVDFYENGTLVGSDTTSPYAFTWVTNVAGPHTLTAVATDNLNATSTSAPVQVTVNVATARTNVALASNGAMAIASSTYASGFDSNGAINGDRKGQSWRSGGGWNDATPGAWPDWLEVDFAGARTIDEVDVFGVQDNYSAPEEPTAGMTFTRYGLTAFTVQYWTGTQWLAVPNGVVVANALVWRQVTFAPIATTKIRILVTGTLDSWSRVTEVEAYQAAGPGNTAPTVTLTAPAAGSTVSGIVTVAANATDDGGVVGVQFQLDGAPLGAEDTTAPFAVAWNTTVQARGLHILTAVARDAAGNRTTSASVSVTVANSTGQVTLAWDASVDPSVTGYKVHIGTTSGVYAVSVVDVGNLTTCTIAGLQAGAVYYIVVTGYDQNGNESGFSNEVRATIQ